MDDHKELIKTLFGYDNLEINKKAIKILGLRTAIFLAELLSNPASDSFFFLEQSTIKEEAGLSEYYQRKAIEKLTCLSIIETKRKGTPPRLWFKINYSNYISTILNREF